jgi:branched-chain amino acid transport system substrate-binding protein
MMSARGYHRILGTAAALAALASSPSLNSARAADPVRLGAPVALTGALADEGHKLLHGYEMCVDAVNARGGIKVGNETRKLDLVQYDYQSDTNTAVQMIQRLVTVDNVDFLMSPYNCGATKVAAVAAERYDTPMIATAAATPSVFDQHFKNLFGVLFPNADITDAEVGYYKDNAPSLKTVAVLAMNSLFPKAIAGQLKDTAQKAGLETVYDGLYSPGTLDFSNVLTEIKGKNADWIYATGFIQDLALLRRQMAGLGVTAKVVTMNAAAAYPEFQRNLGALANNVTSSAWWHPSVTYSDSFLFGGAAQYAIDFAKKYTDEPTYLEAAATAGCEVYVESIEAAGTTKHDAVRNVMSSKRFDTFYGPLKFNADGQNDVAAPVILQIQDGKFKVLAPASVKTGTLAVGVQ